MYHAAHTNPKVPAPRGNSMSSDSSESQSECATPANAPSPAQAGQKAANPTNAGPTAHATPAAPPSSPVLPPPSYAPAPPGSFPPVLRRRRSHNVRSGPLIPAPKAAKNKHTPDEPRPVEPAVLAGPAGPAGPVGSPLPSIPAVLAGAGNIAFPLPAYTITHHVYITGPEFASAPPAAAAPDTARVPAAPATAVAPAAPDTDLGPAAPDLARAPAGPAIDAVPMPLPANLPATYPIFPGRAAINNAARAAAHNEALDAVHDAEQDAAHTAAATADLANAVHFLINAGSDNAAPPYTRAPEAGAAARHLEIPDTFGGWNRRPVMRRPVLKAALIAAGAQKKAAEEEANNIMPLPPAYISAREREAQLLLRVTAHVRDRECPECNGPCFLLQ